MLKITGDKIMIPGNPKFLRNFTIYRFFLEKTRSPVFLLRQATSWRYFMRNEWGMYFQINVLT